MLIKHFRETCVGTISVGNYPNQMILFSIFVANLRKKTTTKRNIGKKNRNKKNHLSKARVAFEFLLFVVEVKNLSTDSVK